MRYYKSCHKCNGTGTIEKIKFITDEIYGYSSKKCDMCNKTGYLDCTDVINHIKFVSKLNRKKKDNFSLKYYYLF